MAALVPMKDTAGNLRNYTTTRDAYLRGEVEVEAVDGPPAEYVAAACRYLGEEQGRAWAAQLEGKPMARLRFLPRWATVLDFETRFPSALSA